MIGVSKATREKYIFVCITELDSRDNESVDVPNLRQKLNIRKFENNYERQSIITGVSVSTFIFHIK